ncbi:MAG: hypothetical protein K9H49_02960 [Bacteroidales bacterium]|nr:hypothetical protein [Bacteroidales bacterium]MCF8389218.1 hypothetical protein [Bacteroidales bacterium]
MKFNKIENIQLSDSWLKAIVIGSLWASFEIIVGSFIHNLRLPFAGTFLSAFAVIFLISFYQIWPEKWIILRAGIICALMKSISPSAVIFGPMIGIFSEALILEFTIILLRKNLFSYMIGGGLAVFSALLHKAVNLVLLYSFDLVKVYVNLVNYAAGKFNLPQSSPQQLIILLSGIYIIAGILSAILGYIIGKKALKRKPERKVHRFENNTKEENNPQSYFSGILLILHVAMLIPGLWFLSQNYNFFLKLLIISSYLLFCLLRYKNLIYRLLKPLFWTQLLIILILAALFLENSKQDFSWSFALYSGFTMVLRALFVIICFSAISREIANPVIKNFLLKKGNVSMRIYFALQTGFLALPIMIENYSEFKFIYKKPLHALVNIVSEAENWLESIKHHQGSNS